MVELFRKSELHFARFVTLGVLAFLCVVVLVPFANAKDNHSLIPVPRQVIYAGQQISNGSLRNRKVPDSYLAKVSVYVERTGLVGKVARTTLVPGRPIYLGNVVEPDVVKVNRPVLMQYQVGSLLIRAEVMPLNNAKAGELVRARNIQTGIIVSGVATTNGAIVARMSQ